MNWTENNLTGEYSDKFWLFKTTLYRIVSWLIVRKKKLSNKEIIVTAKDNGNGHKVIKNVELTVLADWTLELMIGYMVYYDRKYGRKSRGL